MHELHVRPMKHDMEVVYALVWRELFCMHRFQGFPVLEPYHLCGPRVTSVCILHKTEKKAISQLAEAEETVTACHVPPLPAF